MLIKEIGRITDDICLTGIIAFPITLVNTGQHPVLFDGGVSCAADIYIRDIRAILGERTPEIIFLSHVHWDHCGAVSAIKKAFPSIKIAASQTSAGILKKQSALSAIAKLNAEEIVTVKKELEHDQELLTDAPFEPFDIDMILKDGDIIDAGIKIEVIATPGHTRDHLSYYIPSKKILFAGEAGGALDSTEGGIVVEFVSGYEQYLESLKRIAEIPSEMLFQGHRIVFKGKDEAAGFLKRSLDATLFFKTRAYELLDEKNGDVDSVVMKLKNELYDPLPLPRQPEGPYLINLRAQINHLISIR
jgi:glyoxylase-like metal-dependent hydrolase (beta-lactamase superfamily II)